MNIHAYVVCAYKENKYLESCILSLINQSIPSDIIIETSTPCEYITNLANKYNLPVFVNDDGGTCAKDWNYGFNLVENKLITIAHQDDIYEKDYTKRIIDEYRKNEDAIILFTDYYEIREERKVYNNNLLKIKRILLSPLKGNHKKHLKFFKKASLSFGNPICCPAVTLVKEQVGKSPFDSEFKNSCDYKTWVLLANKKGPFVYIPNPLMGHRIYAESHTSIYLRENIRQNDDMQILTSIWGKPIAKFIYYFYSKSEDSNNV